VAAGTQVADIVLGAARRAAVDGIVTLRAIQADRDVQRYVNTPARLIGLMSQLEERHEVKMTCAHPERRWRVREEL
jgi:hypothetical protein